MIEAPLSTTTATPRRLAATLAAVAVLVVAAAAGGRAIWSARAAHAQVPSIAAVYPEPRPLPAFELIAHDGSTYDRARLLGHYTLLFIGFSNCPQLCPATLVELAAASRRLAGLPAALRPVVVMLAVDPRRDTPAVLAGYLAHYDPAFVGVSGPDAALRVLTKALGAFYELGPSEAGAYRVDHSVALFVIDPAARLLAVYAATPAAAALAADYTRLVRARAGA